MKQLPRAAQRGLTLVEMMVSILISMVLSLAIFAVLATAEGRKRTTTSVNDIGQAGNYGMYALDKLLRSAGTGFRQAAAFAYGCPIYASLKNRPILPRVAGNYEALPPPFTGLNPSGTAGMFRLAPFVIVSGGTTPAGNAASDTLVVMGGAAGGAEMPIPIADYPTGTSIKPVNAVAFAADDLLLVTDMQTDAAGNPKPCLIEQVSNIDATTTTLNFAGADYSADTIGPVGLADPSTGPSGPDPSNAGTGGARLINLGSATRMPSLSLVGVGGDNTLFTYDLLRTADGLADPVATPVVDGVFEMHALYGVDDGAGGINWVQANGAYDSAALLAGTPPATLALQTIKAVRVGFFMRTSLRERAGGESSPPTAPLRMFTDLGAGLALERPLVGDELNFRYRTIESTIPIRNSIL